MNTNVSNFPYNTYRYLLFSMYLLHGKTKTYNMIITIVPTYIDLQYIIIFIL